MTTIATQTAAGPREIVARYENDTRRIVTERIDGRTQVIDVAALGEDNYVIEPHVDSQDELDALVSDYLAKAETIGCCPLLPGCRWFN